MYNINILSEVNDENIRVAIIAAVTELMTGDSNLTVNKMKRGRLESPIWNAISRPNINF